MKVPFCPSLLYKTKKQFHFRSPTSTPLSFSRIYSSRSHTKGTEWDFGVFSGLEGVEKPNPRIYEIALERAGNIAPEEALHIGDSMRKDYIPARTVGMHALLLDRFKTPDAENWKQSGAPVLPDLVATKAWLMSESLCSGASIPSRDNTLSSCL